ncbi:hypothetical protein HYH03_014989 [Edaphochlamys debaryana]|uniref:Uncharacterized protein n=1 Tax=Edaphochlamys debaryana TaxID=47281 RepID=A0A835XML1_9CHLO|nr:hypothetical protein HYH03_014989 [Edaphochlamys debaryana]|eukprot:KAG2486284.1 hypothetical protein HYH03_014989 [Edaphochlamys debaryana]
MPVADFVKEIEAKKVTAVQTRLRKEKLGTAKVTDPKKPGTFHTLVHAAVKAGDPTIVDALLAAEPALANAPDHEDCTPLHWAARQDNAKLVEVLVKKKAKVDPVNKAKLTPLHLALGGGRLTVVDALLKAGASASAAPPGGPTPLHHAVSCLLGGTLPAEAYAGAVDRLAAAGAKLGEKDAAGLTPLHRLLAAGRSAEALALAGRPGCGVDELDPTGRSALAGAMAADAPDLGLVQALLAAGASPDVQDPASKDTPLHAAARRGRTDLLALLLPAAKAPHARNAKGACAAELALAEAPDAAQGAAAAEALVAAGGELGEAALGLARAALAKKADGLLAKLVPQLKPSALPALGLDFKAMAAAGLGRTAVACLRAADPKASLSAPLDSEGNTRLHALAQEGGSVEVISALVEAGADPNAPNKEADTPLHVAARADRIEVCRVLVDGGADVTRRNSKNRTPKTQLKITDAIKDYLGEAEEAQRAAKEAKKSALWDDKMKATQTESAFGLRVM